MGRSDSTTPGAGEWILVIDDDDSLRDLIIRTLERNGHEARGAAAGQEALELIAADTPRLLLLDNLLPDMTGREVIGALAERRLPVPFMVMTGQGDERLAVEMMKLGAADYLVKDTELLSRLPAVLERVFRALGTEARVRAVEKALHASEERYRSFVRNATEGIYRIEFTPPVRIDLPEPDLTRALACHAIVAEVNEHLARMYGLRASDMVGRRATEFAPDYGERALLAVRAPNFQVTDQETEDIDASGRPIFLIENFTGVVENGHIIHIWGMQRDVTARKRAEEEKERLQVQLTQAQKMESVGRLAGGVAHDFNNMLGVIMGHADLALAGLGPGDSLHSHLIDIRKAAERSAALTRQLLAFARKQTVAPKVLDLNEVVDGMLKMLRRLIGEDIDLTWLPGADLGKVFIDPSQVDQILANLCVNARDAIAGTGKVTIETDRASFDETFCAGHVGFVPGDFVLLAVSDTGCGMDAETLGHIFEPFFTTKEMGKGTGLGLATVYGIVKQNAGFVNVFSEPGKGTTFRIHFPCHRAKITRPEREQALPATAIQVTGGRTILLVEDESDILKMTTLMLEKLGYAVIPAATPGEAIGLAREHQGGIDLLMTDVVMPEMNGRDLARNLLAIYPDIKRLFVSGYTADIIAHQGVIDEGVQFIQKPFSMQDLAAKIREVLQE